MAENTTTNITEFRLVSTIIGLALLLAGGGFVWRTAVCADHAMRADLLQEARQLVQAVNPNLVELLKGEEDDLESPAYARLKEQFVTLRQTRPDYRFIYLLGRRAAADHAPTEIHFFLDSEPLSSKDYSPPGQIYGEADPSLHRVFDSEAEIVEGPIVDRWGRWVAAHVPLFDETTTKAVAALGIYVDAQVWHLRVLRGTLPALLMLLVLFGLYLTGLSRFSTSDSSENPAKLHRFELLVLAVAGLMLTALAALNVHERETQNRASAFRVLAASKVAGLSETLRELGDVELEGLANHIANTPPLAADSFQRYAPHLVGNSRIQAWEWIPAVPAPDRASFERAVQEAGLPCYRIWQEDGAGGQEPAADRNTYYPVLHLAPTKGNERAYGYDLGSEPLRRAALEEAIRTRLTTGTDPVTLVQETGSQRGMLIFRPVFARDDDRRLLGFALAVLRLGTVLTSAHPDASVSLKWSILRSDSNSQETLADSARAAHHPDVQLAETYPLFFFGKTFTVTATPGPEFERTYPVHEGWQAVLAGILLTATVTMIVGLILRRREALERMVNTQTAELSTSEQRHRAMFEKNRSVQLLVDPTTGRIADANPAACRFYGYSREQLRQMDISQINTLAQPEVFRRMQSAQSEQENCFYFQHRLANGELRDVEVYSSPILVQGRECLYSIVHNITERKQAEAALQHLSDIQRHLMLFAANFVNVPIDRLDESIRQALATLGRLIHADRAYLYDYSADHSAIVATHEWYEDSVPDALHVDRSHGVDSPNAMADAHRKGDLFQSSNISQLPSDTAFHVLLKRKGIKAIVTLPLMTDAGCIGFVGFDSLSNADVFGCAEIELLKVLAQAFTNLKVRARNEAELRQVSAERGMLLDTMSAQVWYLKDPGTYGLANRAHAEFLGLPREAIQNRKLTEFLPPDVAAVCLRSNGAVFAERRAAQTQEWVTLKTGERRLIEIFKNPFLAADGSVAYVVCVGQDTTEKHRLQAEMLQAKEKAEQIARAKATFLAVMAHEIRTPLNVILGYSQIMNRECAECPQKKNIRSIQKSGEHLLELINDLLALSQQDSWSIPLNPTVFDLRQLVEDLRALFADHPDARDLTLTGEFADGVPAVLSADKGKVRQVLLNLIGNAVKFTEKGFVKIVVRRATTLSNTETLISGDDAQSALVVAVDVEDSGCGIPNDQHEGIFESYVNYGAGPFKKRGAGIGLPLSRRYARALGGDLTVDSRLGEGSAFHFTFKAQPADGAQPQKDSACTVRVRKADGQAPRVLVVDDNDTGRAMQDAMLKMVGFDVHDAPSGAQALARLEQGERYDVILLDKCMPDLDGKETLRRIRALKDGSATPVLIFTAAGEPDDHAWIQALGGNGLLHKPIKLDLLLSEIQRVADVICDDDAPRGSLPLAAARPLTAPKAWLDDMASALQQGEISRVRTLARALAQSAPEQAAVVESLVDAYNYDGLEQILRLAHASDPA